MPPRAVVRWLRPLPLLAVLSGAVLALPVMGGPTVPVSRDSRTGGAEVWAGIDGKLPRTAGTETTTCPFGAISTLRARLAAQAPFRGPSSAREVADSAPEALYGGPPAKAASLPPTPPAPAEQSTGKDSGHKDGDRPVYRRGWFYMAATGVAVLMIACLHEIGDGHGGDDGLSPKHDPGFPPPPGGVVSGWSGGERSNR